MSGSQLCPYTANVSFCWEDLGEGCIGRVYYWYDPDGQIPAVDDWELRKQHPQIDDAEWTGLFRDAFERGERELPWD